MDFTDDVWNDENNRTIALGAPIRRFDENYTMESVAERLRRVSEGFVYDGDPTAPGFRRHASSSHAYHIPTSSHVSFARDEGHHSAGGFKSKECERCYHLALRYMREFTSSVGKDDVEYIAAPGPATRQWLEIFFGKDLHLVWAEPGVGLGFWDDLLRFVLGVKLGPGALWWNFRLFADSLWRPIPWTPEMERELRLRGWIPATELVFGKTVRRAYWPVRAWREFLRICGGKRALPPAPVSQVNQ